MNQVARLVMSIFRSSKPHSLSTCCAVLAFIALQIGDAIAALRLLDVCPMEKVPLNCSHLLEEAINKGEYKELSWGVYDPRMKSRDQKQSYLAICNGNVSCRKYSSESGFEDRVKVGNDPVNNGELNVQLLRTDDLLVFVCEVIRKQNKVQLVYKVNVSSSVKCLRVVAGQDVELNQALKKTYQKKNIQDIVWYWQQQKIVHCNLSICVFEDCKSSCPQFRPRLVIKRKTILVLTRVEEGDRALELQYRIFPKTRGGIMTEFSPEIHKLKLDVSLPSDSFTSTSGNNISISSTSMPTQGITTQDHSIEASAAALDTLAIACFFVPLLITLVIFLFIFLCKYLNKCPNSAYLV